jgi:hypothetical protein
MEEFSVAKDDILERFSNEYNSVLLD